MSVEQKSFSEKYLTRTEVDFDIGVSKHGHRGYLNCDKLEDWGRRFFGKLFGKLIEVERSDGTKPLVSKRSLEEFLLRNKDLSGLKEGKHTKSDLQNALKQFETNASKLKRAAEQLNSPLILTDCNKLYTVLKQTAILPESMTSDQFASQVGEKTSVDFEKFQDFLLKNRAIREHIDTSEELVSTIMKNIEESKVETPVVQTETKDLVDQLLEFTEDSKKQVKELKGEEFDNFMEQFPIDLEQKVAPLPEGSFEQAQECKKAITDIFTEIGDGLYEHELANLRDFQAKISKIDNYKELDDYSQLIHGAIDCLAGAERIAFDIRSRHGSTSEQKPEQQQADKVLSQTMEYKAELEKTLLLIEEIQKRAATLNPDAERAVEVVTPQVIAPIAGTDHAVSDFTGVIGQTKGQDWTVIAHKIARSAPHAIYNSCLFLAAAGVGIQYGDFSHFGAAAYGLGAVLLNSQVARAQEKNELSIMGGLAVMASYATIPPFAFYLSAAVPTTQRQREEDFKNNFTNFHGTVTDTKEALSTTSASMKTLSAHVETLPQNIQDIQNVVDKSQQVVVDALQEVTNVNATLGDMQKHCGNFTNMTTTTEGLLSQFEQTVLDGLQKLETCYRETPESCVDVAKEIADQLLKDYPSIVQNTQGMGQALQEMVQDNVQLQSQIENINQSYVKLQDYLSQALQKVGVLQTNLDVCHKNLAEVQGNMSNTEAHLQHCESAFEGVVKSGQALNPALTRWQIAAGVTQGVFEIVVGGALTAFVPGLGQAVGTVSMAHGGKTVAAYLPQFW